MDLENINKAESNFLFVIIFPAAIIFIYVSYLLSYVFTVANIAKLLPILNSKPYSLLIIMLVSYIIGMFIHGIRYVGFIHYKILYDQKIRNAGTRLLFRLFRKGTLVEECLARAREENCTYEWIKDVQKEGLPVIKSMWRIAASIDKEQQVYQFYFYSEIFQCCDTTFLLMSVFQIVPIIYLIIHGNTNMVIINIILIFAFIMMHSISKSIGIAFANRFIHDIDIKRKMTH